MEFSFAMGGDGKVIFCPGFGFWFNTINIFHKAILVDAAFYPVCKLLLTIQELMQLPGIDGWFPFARVYPADIPYLLIQSTGS